MSLIVAKQDSQKLYIVSDTQIYNPTDLNKVSIPVPEAYGLIKSIIINPQICISYAGEIEPVEKALFVCRELNDQINDILNHLVQVNKTSSFRTEFIVCINISQSCIFEIKNGSWKQVKFAWIGWQPGFNIFQSHFHGSIEKDVLSKMESSMTAVIESNINTVNGFTITVTNLTGGFSYSSGIRFYIPPKEVSSGLTVLTYGTVYEGGYTMHFLPSTNIHVLAVHIPQNRMGIIYTANDSVLFRPNIYKDVDEHEFAEIAEKKYSIKPAYHISSLQKSYFERGCKQANKKNYLEAIRFFELALKVNEQHLKADIFYNIGVCLFYLNRPEDGVLSFKKAVVVKPEFQRKVLHFLTNFGRKKI